MIILSVISSEVEKSGCATLGFFTVSFDSATLRSG